MNLTPMSLCALIIIHSTLLFVPGSSASSILRVTSDFNSEVCNASTTIKGYNPPPLSQHNERMIRDRQKDGCFVSSQHQLDTQFPLSITG